MPDIQNVFHVPKRKWTGVFQIFSYVKYSTSSNSLQMPTHWISFNYKCIFKTYFISVRKLLCLRPSTQSKEKQFPWTAPHAVKYNKQKWNLVSALYFLAVPDVPKQSLSEQLRAGGLFSEHTLQRWPFHIC